MSDTSSPPRLRLSHSTVAVKDLDTMLAFYGDVLGFHVTNRGEVPNGGEMAFISQDPSEHHQIVFVQAPTTEHQFVMADHMAFRTGSLDELRDIGERLASAGVEQVMPIDHGNAWSLYFNDPEGNGLEVFVDSPFHVAQPHATGLNLDQSDADVEATTRAEIESLPEFQPMDDWRASFSALLAERAEA